MSDDVESLLREHYRRAAEDVRPAPELVARYRNAGRPTRVAPAWPRVLLAAAAVAAVAFVTWSLLRSPHRSTPVAPPPAPATGAPSPVTRSPSAVPAPVPTVRGPASPPNGLPPAPSPKPVRSQPRPVRTVVTSVPHPVPTRPPVPSPTR